MGDQTFGKRAIAVMKAKGWKRPRLAKEAGVTYDVVRELERRNGSTSVESARKIATALGMDIETLSEDSLSPEERALLSDYRALRSQRRREKLLAESRFLVQEEGPEPAEEDGTGPQASSGENSR